MYNMNEAGFSNYVIGKTAKKSTRVGSSNFRLIRKYSSVINKTWKKISSNILKRLNNVKQI